MDAPQAQTAGSLTLPSNSSNSDLKSAPLLLKDITFDVDNAWRYAFHVIRSFADKETEKLFVRERSRALPKQLQRVALRRLASVVCVKFCKKYFRKFSSRVSIAVGPVGMWES